MDRFLEMQAFNAVVDAGSFIKAANALDMSKAAISRYVVDMETRLGVRLLHRTTRRLGVWAAENFRTRRGIFDLSESLRNDYFRYAKG